MCDENKIVIEDTFQRLHNNVKSKFDTPRDEKSRRVQVFTTAYIPSLQNNALEVRAKTKTDKASYDTVISFDEVEYVDGEDSQAVSIKSTDNTDYNMIPIDQNKNVMVNCTCLDFYYRFAVWNDQSDSLLGKSPDPYVKRGTSKRMPVNPTKTPGVCKHLISLFDHIKREGIVK